MRWFPALILTLTTIGAGACHLSEFPKQRAAAAGSSPFRFCDALHERNRKMVEQILRGHPKRFSIAAQAVDLGRIETFFAAMESADPTRRCFRADSTAGATEAGLLIDGLELGDQRTEEDRIIYSSAELRYSVLWSQFGKEHVFRGPLRETYGCCPTEKQWLQILRAFDYDGDGQPELLLASMKMEVPGGEAAAQYEASLSLVTLRGEGVTPYPHLNTIRFPGFATPPRRIAPDVDGDGRPDLLTWFNYEIPPGCFAESGGAPSPAFVLHASKGGRFTVDDQTTQDFARAWCPRRPLQRLNEVAAADLAAHVICARLWGATAQEMSAALIARCSAQNPAYTGEYSFYHAGAECADASDRGFCGPWIFTIAETAPPFILR